MSSKWKYKKNEALKTKTVPVVPGDFGLIKKGNKKRNQQNTWLDISTGN